MILSGTEIISHSSPLINPINLDNVRPASYDLTIGGEYLISEPGFKHWLPLKAIKLRLKQSFEIPAHAVCYVLCHEKITLPLDLSARVSLRMSHINSGILLAAQPPFDPGYDGYVIVMLHNLSNRGVEMKQGDRVVTMEFNKIFGTPSLAVPRSTNVISLEQSLSKRIVSSMQDLEEKTGKFSKLVIWSLLIMVSLVAVVVAIPAVVTINQFGVLNEHYSEIKTVLQKQKEKLEEQNLAIEMQKKEIQIQQEELNLLIKSKISNPPKELEN